MGNLFKGVTALLLIGLFATTPSSTNYTLKSYDVGNSGGVGTSTNFKLEGSVGGQSGQGTSTSTNNEAEPGVLPTQHTNVPPAPTFVNPGSDYNRLRLTINTGSNPSDTRYLIAISTDNFVTTRYVQLDHTIGVSYTISNYQTYAAWGGASGFLILGLQPSTTYQAKVKAFQGQFSESAFSPVASATTSQTEISFAATTTLTSTPPFALAFSGLSPGTVFSADADVLLDVNSNALYGGSVYVRDQNSGLVSVVGSYTLSSATGDLSSLAKGYGMQVISASQSAGGPFGSLSPFNGAGNNVGVLSGSLQPVASTPGPVTSGAATVRLKAKTDNNVPSASDYSDALTFIAAMQF